LCRLRFEDSEDNPGKHRLKLCQPRFMRQLYDKQVKDPFRYRSVSVSESAPRQPEQSAFSSSPLDNRPIDPLRSVAKNIPSLATRTTTGRETLAAPLC